MTQQINNPDSNQLTLGIPGFEYSDLYDPKRLAELLAVFDTSVQNHDPDLFADIIACRAANGEGLSPEHMSELLVKMAPLVGAFVARLFNVSDVRDRQIETIRGEFDSIFVYRTRNSRQTCPPLQRPNHRRLGYCLH